MFSCPGAACHLNKLYFDSPSIFCLSLFTGAYLRITLIPMEGVCDANLRQIITSVGGFDYCVTGFIDFPGLCY